MPMVCEGLERKLDFYWTVANADRTHEAILDRFA